MHRSALTALLLVLGLVSAACTASLPGQASSAPPSGLEPFYGQELSWGPCAPFVRSDSDTEAFADPAYDCATATVPLDYARPDGETARLGLLRRKAADQAGRIGSLFVNPGGPGSSGMSFVPGFAPAFAGSPLGARFDVVGFDPRGVGASEPVIDCETDAERDEGRKDLDIQPTPEGVALAEAQEKQFVDRCVQRVGLDVLANVGTRDVARDLDILRAAVGDEKLSYLGFSYGTRIGSSYAEAFPGNVRALVLDGAIDPSQSEEESSVGQYAGFQLAFDAFAADCATRPACALGRDPSRAVAEFQALLRPLYDTPVPTGDGRTLGYQDALTGTIRSLYVEQLWEVLRLGIAELKGAGSGRVLMALADDYESRAADGSYSNSLEALPVINCVDQERITDPAVFRDIDAQIRQVAPFLDDGRGPLAARPSCAFWPVPPTSEPRQPEVDGLPPVVVVSVTGDPATPYESGVTLARLLKGSLITVEGNQHTAALQGSSCVDDAVAAYLVDLRLPADGTRCTI